MANETTTKPDPQRPAADPEAAQRLLAEAMKRPGVKELVEAYEDARRYEEAVEAYQAQLTPPTVEWVSDSTAPDVARA